MNRYVVTYFDGVDYKKKEASYLAESESQLREHIDQKVLEPRFRRHPQITKNSPKGDSLEIFLEEESVEIPYMLIGES